MQEREKKILENFAEIIPKLSEADKSYLLGLGEGMLIKIEMPKKELTTKAKTAQERNKGKTLVAGIIGEKTKWINTAYTMMYAAIF